MSTASAIASTVEDLEGEGRFDLILFGNESADSGGYQVGVRVAHALGRPTVTGIKGIEVEQGTVRLRRDTATGSELYRLPLPAVVSVKEGINLPRYPTLKGRLEAKKAEVRVVEKERVGSGQTMLRLVSPSQVASETTILPDAAAVVDLLEQLQVVR
jgi:electron transfer flavoprotein beta subunit